MASDNSTLAYYDTQAANYATRAADHTAQAPLEEFVAAVPSGGDVLDFGCGAAWAAAHFRDNGLNVTALDGSAGLAAEARARYGIDVTVAPFESLDAISAFDRIWASFCLLHVPRAQMSGHLLRLATALRPGGVLYLGLKEGTGERIDPLGRHYTYFAQDEISDLLKAAGFGPARITAYSAPGMEGKDEPCLHIFANRD